VTRGDDNESGDRRQTGADDVAMESSLISCVIPAFNAESFIKETIDSALNQTYSKIEVIVVDDGSRDRTADIARSYGSRVRCLVRPHRGAGAAKNAGVLEAQGEFIAFLDADDLWHPDKLTQQIARIAERPEIDLCYTQYRNFWIPELAAEKQEYEGHALSNTAAGWSVSTLLTRRGFFDQYGYFEETDARKHLNLIWALGAARRGAIIDVLADVLMSRRLHHGNMSREWAIDEDFFKLLKKWKDYKNQQGGGDNANPSVG